MKKLKTEQEKFWAGKFGNEYITRNENKLLVSSNLNLFSKILCNTFLPKSVIEYGANIGLNLIAIKQLLPDAKIDAVEINERAVKELKKNDWINVHHSSILDFHPPQQFDFVFTKVVLIHINPDKLNTVYDLLYSSSKRYIGIFEYYNPTPMTLSYRGNRQKLFKRDFASELMQKYNDLKLINYCFIYHKDSLFPQDDLTCFLLEKNKK